MDKTSKRIWELDLFRGIAVVLMIFDHMMFDIWGLLPEFFNDFPGTNQVFNIVYRFSISYWQNPIRLVVRYLVIFVFLGITGICCTLSRNNTKRGLKLLAVAMALTVGTGIYGFIVGDMDETITFGILHCIAVSLLIVALLEKFCVDKRLYLLLGGLCIILGAITESGQTFASYYDNNFLVVMFNQILGITYSGGDSFQLPLNLGMILIGVYLGKQFYLNRTSIFHKEYKNNLITFTGRNSLLLYFLHQLLLPIFMALILLCCGYKISF